MPTGIQVLIWDALIRAHAPAKLAFSERAPFAQAAGVAADRPLFLNDDRRVDGLALALQVVDSITILLAGFHFLMQRPG